VTGPAPSPAHAELAASDPRIARLIEAIDPAVIDERLAARDADRFLALARIVVGQQVSTAAARTVWGRVLDAFEGAPTPALVAAPGGEEKLRGAGLSGRKASYIAGLAAAIEGGELNPAALDQLDDETVAEAIVALRGFGPWSAEMFLMFDLRRPDVFSGGDLGLRRGIQIAYELEEMPSPEEATAIAERWRPNRSLACFYLWAAAGMKTPLPPPK
jgi:DNA-3-methyladenine glycosylase II